MSLFLGNILHKGLKLLSPVNIKHEVACPFGKQQLYGIIFGNQTHYSIFST